ncbi:M23 family metallopeptidase [Corynebacterium pseudotuberculosis]|uniref:M23 family metallopeptidase n=1 Tax=Corynebacterium pseudotuberculosis TaxID=1719 RepID=UPI00061D06D9|nr:M23 family metallopeptidase [Corynebacterium pseudotuberculosis]ALU19749.1 peptidase M23 [Corynebacterium pseudotuberculosis]ANH26074.1 M23 peptidase domain-containing protein [Corynebacterium pseudotuberculosis]
MTLFHLRLPNTAKGKKIFCQTSRSCHYFYRDRSTPPVAYGYIDPASGNRSAQRVLKGFKKPEYNWLPGHRGVDLELSVGANVLAAESGIVAFSGTVARTPTISIDHPDGIRTTYQPVFTSLRKGDSVRIGDVIGQLAPSTDGNAGLHWGAFTGNYEYINPLSLLDAPTIRLKPLAGLPNLMPADAIS